MASRRTSVSSVITLLYAAAAGAGLLDVAAAQETGRSITRSPGHGPRGTVITVRGEGCEENGTPYEIAHLYLYDNRGSNHGFYRGDKVPVEDDGTFTGTVTVPANATPGKHTVTADCQAADMLFIVGEEPFTVDGPSPTPTTPPTASPTRPTTPPPTSRPPATPSPTPSRIATTPPTIATPTTAAPTIPAAVALTAPPAVPVAASGTPRTGIASLALLLLAGVGTGVLASTRPAPRR